MTADPFARLDEQLAILGTAITQWNDRDRAADKAAARQAANTVVDAVDAMLRQLYVLRGQLVTEIRRADDARAQRVDEMLRQHRDGGAS